jgi:alkyl hydroperoxide reductase subunit D
MNPMSLDDLKALIPDYAKDVKLNLGNVLGTPGLTVQQIWGTALASAIAARNPKLLQAIAAAAAEAGLTPQATAAAKTAASVMAMNNVYYRFVHLSGEPEYKTMPARLRMNGLASHGVDKLDFELWCLAVSAINGCGMCIESHQHEVVKGGATKDVVQNIIRIASVIQAMAVTLEAVEALGDVPVAA